MPTPSKQYYSGDKREERLARKRAGMQRYRASNPEAVTASDKRFYEAHKKERIAHVAKWVKENPKRTASTQRNCHLKINYGITTEDWHSMFLSQGKKCPICQRSEVPGKNPWDVDHDHATGKVRGILCHHCNVMLGMAKDNPEVLRSAISYLIDRP